ncbi:MAG: protein translocase subunit SecF [Acidimicrobiia bacterium]
MTRLRDFLRGETNFDFVGRRGLWLRISAVALMISLLALVVRDLNLGIEFRGGLSIIATNPSAATVEDLRGASQRVGISDAVIQLVDDGATVRLQTPALDAESQGGLLDVIASVTGAPRAEISVDAVGPTFGALIFRQSLIALAVFLGAVMLFMTWRLEWKMAAAGIVSLLHDLVITMGVYAVTGFEVTPATVVAVLTILGYSLYDTVVVFDKIEEHVGDYADRMTYSAIANRATNQIMPRSVITALTSLLPVGSILFVGAFIFGATSLRDFALALFVGIAVGTYSSVCVATPFLATWKEREEDWISRRRRLEAKGQTVSTTPSPTAIVVSPAQVRGTGATPRPPKKRRR